MKKSTDDLDKSILKYRQFVEISSVSVGVLEHRVDWIYPWMVRYSCSIRFFKITFKKIQIQLRSVCADLLLAETYLKLNRFQEAQDEYEKISKQARDEKRSSSGSVFYG